MPYSQDPKHLISLSDKCFTSQERMNSESTWDELSTYILNSQSGLFNSAGTATRGAKKAGQVYDSTGIQAAEDLASAMNDTLTNRAVQWSKFRFTDDEMNEDEESVAWLEDSNNRLFRALDKSNFYNEASKAYKSYTGLANMVVIQEEREPGPNGEFRGFVFKAWHLSEVAWMDNKDGSADVIFRRFKMTAKQAVEAFGVDELGPKVIRAYEKDPTEEFNFLHVIMPRDPKKVSRNEVGMAPPKERPVASIYLSVDDIKVVKEDGYYNFPVRVVRHSLRPGDTIGTGPAHIAINDIRTLNEYVKLDLKAKAIAALPPIFIEQRAVIGNMDLRPGGVSYVNNIQQIKQYETQARFDVNQEGINELRSRIRSIFYLDKLLLPPREKIGEMSAYETAQRVQEMQRILGPVFSVLNDDWLTPTIKQCYETMRRRGAFKKMPEKLRGRLAALDIEYVNPLARAQKIEQVNAIQQWAQLLGGIAQLGKPEIMDNFEADNTAVLTGRILGVPESVIADSKDVDAIRQQRQQATEQQIQMENAQKQADIQAKQAKGTSNPSGSPIV